MSTTRALDASIERPGLRRMQALLASLLGALPDARAAQRCGQCAEFRPSARQRGIGRWRLAHRRQRAGRRAGQQFRRRTLALGAPGHRGQCLDSRQEGRRARAVRGRVLAAAAQRSLLRLSRSGDDRHADPACRLLRHSRPHPRRARPRRRHHQALLAHRAHRPLADGAVLHRPGDQRAQHFLRAQPSCCR